MHDYIYVIDNGGTDDPDQLLRAAQFAMNSGLYFTNFEARCLVQTAVDELGVEAVVA